MIEATATELDCERILWRSVDLNRFPYLPLATLATKSEASTTSLSQSNSRMFIVNVAAVLVGRMTPRTASTLTSPANFNHKVRELLCVADASLIVTCRKTLLHALDKQQPRGNTYTSRRCSSREAVGRNYAHISNDRRFTPKNKFIEGKCKRK